LVSNNWGVALKFVTPEAGQNIINKINKERWRSMPPQPQQNLATRNSGKEPRWTSNKNRTGHKAEHGQANH
jgi:hypothetical protein